MSEKTSEGGSVRVDGDWKLPGEGGTREFAMREWGSNGRWGKISIEGGEWDLRSGRGWGEGMGSLGGSSGSRGSKKKRNKVRFCGCGDVGVVGLLIGVGAVINTGVIFAGKVKHSFVSGRIKRPLLTDFFVLSPHRFFVAGTYIINFNSH